MLNEQEKAYITLLHSNATSLPIDPFKLKVSGYSWTVLSKFEAKREGVLDRDFLRNAAEKYEAFTFESGSGEHYIVYDDKLASEERRIDIYHEICHIVYGHTSNESIIGKAHDQTVESDQEKEADYYSFIAPAPPCILADEGIYDPDTISKVTLVSAEHATAIAAEVQRYKKTKRTKFEKELSKKFNTKRYRDIRRGKRIAIITSIVIVTASLFFGGFSLISHYYNPGTIHTNANENTIIYITRAGNKFHKEHCPTIKNSELTQMTIAEAIKAGYGACNTCNPLDK